jgi:HK97 family phage prohead protease
MKRSKQTECECTCEGCAGGDCSQCSNAECKDSNCKDCPMQDEENSIKIGERRALLARMGGEVRSLGADVVRALAKETQDALKTIMQTRAACYALMQYLCYMRYDEFPDGIYTSLYECYACCGLCIDLIGSESNLSSAAQALCAAACDECSSACTGTLDVMLQACISLCAACGVVGAEGRAARMAGDEVRACKIEFRKAEDGHIKGYPILFSTLSEDLGGFRERILPDAIQFADDLKADFNHNPDYILGRTLAGTLKVSTDARGAFMDADPPDTTWARDLKVSIDRGDIDQGSFSFRVLPGGQQITEENGQQVRTLSKILVRRVSVVSDPAYTKTSIEVRSKGQGEINAAGHAAPPATAVSGVLNVLRRRADLALVEG